MKYKKQKRKEYTFKGLIYFQASTKSTRYISKCRSNLKTLVRPLLSLVSLRRPGQSCSSWSCLLRESTSWLTAGETESRWDRREGCLLASLQGPINTDPTFATSAVFIPSVGSEVLVWTQYMVGYYPLSQLVKSNLKWSKWCGQDFRINICIFKGTIFIVFIFKDKTLSTQSVQSKTQNSELVL